MARGGRWRAGSSSSVSVPGDRISEISFYNTPRLIRSVTPLKCNRFNLYISCGSYQSGFLILGKWYRKDAGKVFGGI